jgi:hypothetical protein
VLLRFSFLNLRQPAFPVNRLCIFGYVEVFRQDGLATDGATERQRRWWVWGHCERISTLGSQ